MYDELFNILTIILGLYIGSLIMQKTYQIERFHGPNSNNVKKMIFHDPQNNKYYQYEPKITFCPVSAAQKK